MARGWESKAIEAQQEAATQARDVKAHMTVHQAALHTRRATLQLARTRAVADLQAASLPAHRAMLEASIAEIDRILADVI